MISSISSVSRWRLGRRPKLPDRPSALRFSRSACRTTRVRRRRQNPCAQSTQKPNPPRSERSPESRLPAVARSAKAGAPSPDCEQATSNSPRGIARSHRMSQSSSLRDKRPRTGTFHGHHQTGNASSTSQLSPFPQVHRGISFAHRRVSLFVLVCLSVSTDCGDTRPAKRVHRSHRGSRTLQG
jgi:hypothetical protein